MDSGWPKARNSNLFINWHQFGGQHNYWSLYYHKKQDRFMISFDDGHFGTSHLPSWWQLL